MNYLTIDDEFRDHLHGILEPIELRDGKGKVLGTFMPLVTPDERAQYEKARKLFDPVEMERILKEESGQGVPLAQILQRLRTSETVR